MIRWLSNVKIEQKHSTEDLRRRIHVHHIKDVLRWNRLMDRCSQMDRCSHGQRRS